MTDLIPTKVFEILLFIIALEVAVYMLMELVISISYLITKKPKFRLKIPQYKDNIIETDETAGLTGQFIPKEDEKDVTVEERLWAMESGAKTDTQIKELVQESRKTETQ